MKPLLSIGGFKTWSALSRSTKPAELFDTLGEAGEDKLREEFTRWLLQLLKAQVQECIRLQRFPVEYEPLKPAWADFKARHGLHPGFWIATGTLVDTLSVWKQKGEKVWNLGWRPGVKNPLNGESVAEIAAALEFGNEAQNRPARPLFTILAARMQKNVYRLFYAFCREKHPSYIPHLPRP